MLVKSQSEFDFPALPEPDIETRAEQGHRAWDERLLPVIRAAIERIGPKTVAPLLGVGDTLMSDALAQRSRKGVRCEWLVVLLFTAPPSVRHELVAEINRLAGYEPPHRRKKISPEDELAIRKRETKRLAPGIEALIEEAVREAG